MYPHFWQKMDPYDKNKICVYIYTQARNMQIMIIWYRKNVKIDYNGKKISNVCIGKFTQAIIKSNKPFQIFDFYWKQSCQCGTRQLIKHKCKTRVIMVHMFIFSRWETTFQIYSNFR